MTQSVDSPPRAAIARVILCVRGGVAETMLKPRGVEVLIFDYDVDGADPVDHDPDGNPCAIQTHPAHEKVTANKHWPIVRTAAKKLHPPSDPQRGRCPQCRRTVQTTAESLADADTPGNRCRWRTRSD